jgi:hypothetical protein
MKTTFALLGFASLLVLSAALKKKKFNPYQ